MTNTLQVTQPQTDLKTYSRGNQKVGTSPEMMNDSGIVEQNVGENGLPEKLNIDFESGLATFLRMVGGENETSREVLAQGPLFLAIKEIYEAKDGEKQLEALENRISFVEEKESAQFMEKILSRQMKFSGELFDGMKQLFSQTSSPRLKDSMGAFLKVYNNFVSGRHLLQQMKTVGNDMADLMMRNESEMFEALMAELDETAQNGQTEQNTAVINQKILPFISKYISATHDFGAVRDAGVLFTLYAARYENGSTDNLLKAFEQMKGYREFNKKFPSDQEQLLQKAIAREKQIPFKGYCEKLLAKSMSSGSLGKGGAESAEAFREMLSSSLLNESVYMPCLHTVFPMIIRDKEVDSEIWYAPEKKASGKDLPTRLFLVFTIEDKGKFQMLLKVHERNVSMNLQMPADVKKTLPNAEKELSHILKRNGFKTGEISVTAQDKRFSLEKVFPEIVTEGRSLNVRI